MNGGCEIRKVMLPCRRRVLADSPVGSATCCLEGMTALSKMSSQPKLAPLRAARGQGLPVVQASDCRKACLEYFGIAWPLHGAGPSLFMMWMTVYVKHNFISHLIFGNSAGAYVLWLDDLNSTSKSDGYDNHKFERIPRRLCQCNTETRGSSLAKIGPKMGLKVLILPVMYL